MSHNNSVLRSESLRLWTLIALSAAVYAPGCSSSSDQGDDTAGGQASLMGGAGGNLTGAGGNANTGGHTTGTGGKKTGGTSSKASTTTQITCTTAMRGTQGCACLLENPPCLNNLQCDTVVNVCCTITDDCDIPAAGTGGKSSVGGGTSTGGAAGGVAAGGTLADGGIDDGGTEGGDASLGGGTATGGHSTSGGTTSSSTATANIGGIITSGGSQAVGGATAMGGFAAAGGATSATCAVGYEQCSCYPNDTCIDLVGLKCFSGICVNPNSNTYPADAGPGLDAGCWGAEWCNCYPNATCNGGLTCLSNMCVLVPPDAGL